MKWIGRSFMVSAPPIAVGSLLAHEAAYRLSFTDAHQLEHRLAATGHGYLDHLSALVALLVAVALGSVVLGIADGFRGRPERRLPAWPFALLPPLSFALQEHLERLAHGGSIPWHAVAEPTFGLGLLLQLPFGLLAYLAARALLAGARTVGRVLARLVRPRRRSPSLQPPRRASHTVAPRLPALAIGYGERGPPIPARP